MSIEDWDRTLLGMTKQEYAAMKRKKKFRILLDTILEAVGDITLFVLIATFTWLCCAVSGYHWE
jgi:hypothetical protein